MKANVDRHVRSGLIWTIHTKLLCMWNFQKPKDGCKCNPLLVQQRRLYSTALVTSTLYWIPSFGNDIVGFSRDSCYERCQSIFHYIQASAVLWDNPASCGEIPMIIQQLIKADEVDNGL